MRPASHLGDCRGPWGAAPLVVERLEPGISIGLEKAGKACQMLRRMLGTAIGAVEVGGDRRRRAAEWPVVANIYP